MKVSEEKIIEAAYALFKQRGIRSTSLQNVARACGTRLWEVNLLFKSKKDLLLAVVRHVVNKKAVYLLISSSLSPSAVTELNTFFKFVDDTIGALGADILAELKRYHPLALDHVKDIVDGTLIPCLQKNMQRGLSEGFYRPEVDTEFYAVTYFYILRTVLESERDWTQTKEAIRHINDIFLHGVLNAKGMRI
jgi:TetR/AcrR family transcriptional regulator, cholesterol catabolism regulator